MKIRKFIAGLAAAAVAALSLMAPAATPALAQTYPVNTPSYIPTAVLAPVTCSAAFDVTFQTNGVGTATVRISGSGTGIAAVVQGTNERTSAPNWSTLGVHPISGSSATALSIASTGFWRVNTTGLTAIRVHLTAVTGSVTIAVAAAPGAGFIQASPDRRATYSAAVTGLAPASSATDFFTITGSATTTIRITNVQCSGVSTAAATATVNAVLRSTADTSGTSSAATAVPHDSTAPAASATVLSYTANPTTGTLVGTVRSGKLTTVTAASTALNAAPLSWDFGREPEQQIILRGTTQVFALNGAGASFTSGASLNCSVTWTEE